MGHFNSPVIRKLTSPRIWLESSPQQKKAKGKHSKSIIPSIMERHIYVCHLACKWTTWIKQYICNYIQHLSRVYGPSWAIISVPPLPHSPSPKKNWWEAALSYQDPFFQHPKATKATNPQLRRLRRFFADVVPMGVSSLGFTTSKASCTSMLSWEPMESGEFCSGILPWKTTWKTPCHHRKRTKFPEVSAFCFSNPPMHGR